MRTNHWKLLMAGLLCIAASGFAKPLEYGEAKVQASAEVGRIVDNSTYINANNILMFVTNHGNFGRDLSDVFGRDAGTFFPYVSNDDITSGLLDTWVIYAAGLWIGGMVNGETRVAIAEYSDEFIPGPMDQVASVNGNDTIWTYNPAYDSDPTFKVYKIHTDSLADNPNNDYTNWPAHHGAPVYPNDGRPFWMGEQTLWTVCNDANPDQHQNDAGRTEPLGIEVQMTVWAADSEGTDITLVADPLTATNVGPGHGTVQVYVADHTALTADEYMVVFEEHVSLGLVWHVINMTTGVPLLINQTNQSGEGEYPVVDGMLIRVAKPEPGLGGVYEVANASGVVDPPGDVFCAPNSTDEWQVESTVGCDMSFIGQWGEIGLWDYEYRFTAGGSQYYDWYSGALQPDRALFEVWNIGIDTPGDPSDDQRMIMAVIDDDESGGWSWGDRIYAWNSPYVEPLPPDRFWVENPRLGRVRLVDLNAAGSAPDEGTIVQFVTYLDTINTPADTFIFSAPTYTLVETGGEGNAIYIEYKLYNKGGNTIENCYVSMWNDPDLGGAADDLVGCDTLSDIFFCYNGTDWDNMFGARVPAVGYKLLDGPIVVSQGDTANFAGYRMPGYRNLGMTSHATYINGTDPNDFNETYNYMQGLQADGSPFPNGTGYMYPGDPVAGTGDLDFDPADRRFFGSSGPFTFMPGDSQFVRYKLAVGQGVDRLESITKMNEILNAPLCCRHRGDINHQDAPPIDIADIVYLINYMFQAGAPPVCIEEADVNGDGEELVDIADLVYLIDYAFTGGPPPPRCR